MFSFPFPSPYLNQKKEKKGGKQETITFVMVGGGGGVREEIETYDSQVLDCKHDRVFCWEGSNYYHLNLDTKHILHHCIFHNPDKMNMLLICMSFLSFRLRYPLLSNSSFKSPSIFFHSIFHPLEYASKDIEYYCEFFWKKEIAKRRE